MTDAAGRTVAITGVGGLVGRRLVDALDADPDVTRIVGLDVVLPSGLRSSKLTLQRVDVLDRPALVRAIAGADVVVHLAFQLDPLRDERRMRAINVDGTRNVAAAVHETGVWQLVYVSSAAVYGAHDDNPLPISESDDLRANTGFSYAAHELAVEDWLGPWAWEHPDTVVTVLRPTVVGGPGVDNFVSRQLSMPRIVTVKGHRPPMQFVHVDDLVSALVHVVGTPLPGAFNVASEGWLSFGEITAIVGRRLLEVPEEIAFTLADRLWRLGLTDVHPGQLPYVMHPWVVSVDALLATGWRPERSNRDALAELIADHADDLVLGRLRTSRSRARQVGSGVLLVVALATLAGRRRRRHRLRRAAAVAQARRAAASSSARRR